MVWWFGVCPNFFFSHPRNKVKYVRTVQTEQRDGDRKPCESFTLVFFSRGLEASLAHVGVFSIFTTYLVRPETCGLIIVLSYVV